ncbi:MAG: hypothetical protein Q8P67_20990 [archaeon]|nr:hypothetical protein [archaeon]
MASVTPLSPSPNVGSNTSTSFVCSMPGECVETQEAMKTSARAVQAAQAAKETASEAVETAKQAQTVANDAEQAASKAAEISSQVATMLAKFRHTEA